MRVSSDFRELARRALSGKWGSAVLTTLVASILGADIAMAGGPSVSRVTNYVSNTMEMEVVIIHIAHSYLPCR